MTFLHRRASSSLRSPSPEPRSATTRDGRILRSRCPKVGSPYADQPPPLLVAIPLFDPAYYYEGKMNGRNASLKFVNYMGFFVEQMNGNEVQGRITPIGGLRLGGRYTPKGAFPRVIRLVQ